MHIEDIRTEAPYRERDPAVVAIVDVAGARTIVIVPMLKENQLIGAIGIYRQEVRPFADQHIELLTNFAKQAVIAVENTRLLTQQREALEQQTATAEVLQVINSSPGDLGPVFEAMLDKAMRLCDGAFGILRTYDGELLHVVAARGVPEAYAEMLRTPVRPHPDNPLGRMLRGERVIASGDVADEEPYRSGDPVRRAFVELGGARSAVQVALVKDGNLLGSLTIYRQEVRPFSDKQIALLQNFAAQAVIAMENARLITETREALERQTATAEVLQVINSSPGDLAPVFDAILEQAHRLCGVSIGFLGTWDSERFRAVAARGIPVRFEKLMREPFHPSPNSPHARLVSEKCVIQIPDLATESAWGDDLKQTTALEMGIRTVLFVPLRKEGMLLGWFSANRREVRPFSDKEIKLLESFAAQAVIAMENARLLGELRQRTTELARSVDELTATGDVLKIISRSTVELETVLGTLVETVARLCHADHALMYRRRDDRYHLVAEHGLSVEAKEFILAHPFAPDRGTAAGRAALERSAVHIPDVLQDPEYTYAGPKITGARTMLGIPLLREEALVGIFVVARRRVAPFANKEIELTTTFADQAVIAIENARLFEELRDRQAELARSVDELTATGDVLKIISRSSVDLETVLDTLVETVTRLCRADQAVMWRRQDDMYQVVAAHGLSEEAEAFVLAHPVVPGRGIVSGRAALERRPVQVADVLQDPEFTYNEGQKLGGFRTVLGIPLLREDTLVGMFGIHRTRVEPFTDKEIELATTFADQAVIAIENARLFDEVQARVRDLTDSLEQQKATSEILRVISSSPTDVQPVFDTIVRSAVALCDGVIGAVNTFDGELTHVVAVHNYTPEALAAVRRLYPMRPSREQLVGRAILSRAVAHQPDVLNDPEYAPDIALAGGWRAGLAVPLIRNELPVGAIVVMRARPGAFLPGQIELLKTFAEQAVIAIENARLFGELRQRTTELARSVDELTATGDVLKIISRSSVELDTVLGTLVETVARLCRADHALMYRRRDDKLHLVASCGLLEEAKAFVETHPLALDRGTVSGRVGLERRAVQIPDVMEDTEFTYGEHRKLTGARTLLGVPLLRGDELIGIFSINRTRVEPFTSKEIELATTFADQAVIAIENARLFDELRERQAELRVTFDNMGDGVVMFDAESRLTAWNRNFQEMLELPEAFLAGRPSLAEYFRYLVARGEYSADLEAELSRTVEDTTREMRYERTRRDGRVIEVRRNPVPGGGFVVIFSDITERKRAEEAIRAARDAAEMALRELQTAQASLVHAQKMAALGQLTAGIAHEIKNPLNFVNNFAGLSVELLDELKQASAKAIGALDAHERAEIVETIGMLTGNLEKIAEHGRRADGIVKSMLQHSRGGSGDWQATDLNALVEEALNLAYHGARAQDQSFNITMERDLDRNLAPIEIVPQDLMRVFLNLIGNGFYAANKRSRAGGDRPVLKVTTRDPGDAIEIRVRDNGIGISPEHREKLFQPFFTTKPTGEGTGLGLSISFDIVTQQHGGTITVESEVGEFTEFTVRLPRRQHPMAGRAV